VVVEAGLTVSVPEGGRAPLPGTMVTDETPVAFQLSNELPPALILAGLAVNETTGKEGGGGAAPTVTVACLVTVPAALLAVRV